MMSLIEGQKEEEDKPDTIYDVMGISTTNCRADSIMLFNVILHIQIIYGGGFVRVLQWQLLSLNLCEKQ